MYTQALDGHTGTQTPHRLSAWRVEKRSHLDSCRCLKISCSLLPCFSWDDRGSFRLRWLHSCGPDGIIHQSLLTWDTERLLNIASLAIPNAISSTSIIRRNMKRLLGPDWLESIVTIDYGAFCNIGKCVLSSDSILTEEAEGSISLLLPFRLCCHELITSKCWTTFSEPQVCSAMSKEISLIGSSNPIMSFWLN